MVVLGLSVSTRMLGLAVISGGIILDYHIKLRKEPWNASKQEMILASLAPWCSSFPITNVALSIPYAHKTSSQNKTLLESIKRYFTERKIPLCSYPPQALQELCTEASGVSKKEVMKTLAELYPELGHYYRKEVENINKYYVKLFEAVGVATIHIRKMKEKR
jgi:hypothetical protein